MQETRIVAPVLKKFWFNPDILTKTNQQAAIQEIKEKGYIFDEQLLDQSPAEIFCFCLKRNGSVVIYNPWRKAPIRHNSPSIPYYPGKLNQQEFNIKRIISFGTFNEYIIVDGFALPKESYQAKMILEEL